MAASRGVAACGTVGLFASGSFNWEDRRWPAHVKGKPGQDPVLRTLDTVWPTGVARGMNDPEVTMLDSHASTDLVAHRKALQAAGAAIRLVMRLPAPLKPIADQVIRAASSVPANLAEGHGRSGRDRPHLWRIAYASAKEVDSHLRLLVATGAVNPSDAKTALDRFDEVRAMTWRLLNPQV